MKKIIFNTELNERNIVLRNRIISLLGKYIQLEDSNALEVGIGNGRFGILIGKEFKSYSGFDIDKEYVKIAKNNSPEFDYKQGSAEKIPFNKKFDVLLYTLSWHMIKDLDKALNEARRVLKENGIISIIDPAEKETGWGDPRLNIDSPKFTPEMLGRKLKELKRGRDKLESQKLFNIIEKGQQGPMNYWILKIK